MKEQKAREYITELFKIVGTNSILIVLSTGRVKRLYCPFVVICNVEVSPFQRGGEYAVEAVKMTLQKQDVFIIEGRAYFVWYFKIIV
jgi:hypothetical protein